MITVKDIVDLMEEKAPFDTAEDWDNSGLLVGDENRVVKRVHIALDITAEVINEAKECGADLIISHHPVIFSPLSSLDPAHPVYQLAKADIAALCVHTNLDKAMGGVNDRLAAVLGMDKTEHTPGSMCRIGTYNTPLSAEDFAAKVNTALGTAVRMRAGSTPIKRVVVCGGAAGELVLSLLPKADAAVTGELKHHEWLLVPPEKTVIDAGHYATEVPVIHVLKEWITEAFSSLTVTLSAQTAPYQTVKD